jgi:hypothetical protein
MPENHIAYSGGGKILLQNRWHGFGTSTDPLCNAFMETFKEIKNWYSIA